MRGSHVIKHWSSNQTTVALSSAEAELSGIYKGSAQGLGLHSLANDLNISLSLDIQSDSTAAIGICKRTGAWNSSPPPCSRSLGAGQTPHGLIYTYKD